MSVLKRFTAAGEPAGEEPFDDALLVLDRGGQAVKDQVTATRNARRPPVASTLRKGEVAGSNKKPWKQKGTGRARAGLRQSPVWRGGGVAFGPHPRPFGGKINRKVARLAFRRALSEKIAGGQVLVVEQVEPAEPRTRLLAALLARLGATRACLIAPDRVGEALRRAARNLPKVEVAAAAEVDVYSLLRCRTVVTTRAGLDALVARLRAKPEVAA
jgi:large subunit ribosomal protein L4